MQMQAMITLCEMKRLQLDKVKLLTGLVQISLRYIHENNFQVSKTPEHITKNIYLIK